MISGWCIYCKWYLDDMRMCINSESRHFLDFMGEYNGCEKYKKVDIRGEEE